ncbi:restriction endonuclease subunit S [Gracilibacillus sp. D59]|uniref:restriction endonuclease subunit S n=1 Tax=Gracilibacillus sp. D59 TaxID=3457434 RepID=UPI003FCD106B
MGNKQIPAIRFTGFTGDWERQKLGELCEEFQSGKNIKSKDILDEGKYPVFGGNGFRGYTNTYNYDGLYALIGRQGALCGNMNISHGKAYFTEHAIVVKGNKKNETRFLYYLFGKMNLGQYSGQSAQPGLAVNKLKEITAFIPTLAEQAQISVLFKKLDDTIALHQQELEILKQTKQGFLQKMFPKEGESVPEIRIPGFTGDWEHRKVLDFSENSIGGGTPRTSIKKYWDGDIPWIQSSDLQEHQVSGIVAKKRITETGLTNSATKLVPKNSIAIVTRVGFGKIALMEFEYATSQDFLSLVNLKVNKWFGTYSLYNQLQKKLNNVQGTSIKGITKKELLNMKIYIPTNIDEQTKIGNFFKKLDDTIALQEKELETLKQTKKAFLQKMFV